MVRSAQRGAADGADGAGIAIGAGVGAQRGVGWRAGTSGRVEAGAALECRARTGRLRAAGLVSRPV